MNKQGNLDKKYYFFIGTVAELIKIYPVVKEFKKNKTPFSIISSGQNTLTNNELLEDLSIKSIDILLYTGAIKQSAVGLFTWFVRTLIKGYFKLWREFGKDKKNIIVIVHGDTVTTVLGAILAKLHRVKLAHVEAGLRSFNYLHPFPEEIDRVVVSKMADIHFCPNQWCINNLGRAQGLKINTIQNTLYESLQFALEKKLESSTLSLVKNKKFFIFIMHRQENLLSSNFIEETIDNIVNNTNELYCVFVMHQITKATLGKKGLLNKIKKNPKIVYVDRLSYIEFMKVLDKSEFIITDGGSNQEETYYLGKPCLILRSVTERIEGLDQNVTLYNKSKMSIQSFIKHYKKFKRSPIKVTVRPSEIIYRTLLNFK